MPDLSGSWHVVGEYGGQPRWQHEGSAWGLWFEPLNGTWYVGLPWGNAPSDPETDGWWAREGDGPAGDYLPFGTAQGNLTITSS